MSLCASVLGSSDRRTIKNWALAGYGKTVKSAGEVIQYVRVGEKEGRCASFFPTNSLLSKKKGGRPSEHHKADELYGAANPWRGANL